MSEDNFHKLKNMVLLKEIFFFLRGGSKSIVKLEPTQEMIPLIKQLEPRYCCLLFLKRKCLPIY